MDDLGRQAGCNRRRGDAMNLVIERTDCNRKLPLIDCFANRCEFTKRI